MNLQVMAEEVRREAALKFTVDMDDQKAREIINDVIGNLYPELGLADSLELGRKAFNDMRQLGALQPLLDNPSVTEIMINGKDNIFIEQKGRVFRSNVYFETEDELRKVINDIVSCVNRNVTEAEPIVDARLADGSRVNVVIPPISLVGPVVTIRKFPEKPMDLEDLIRFGSITPQVADFLVDLVKAKYNIFISGGTGSGKTSFLNALSAKIPHHERIITIEDSAELQLKTIDNLVSLETRNANVEGKGAVPMQALIKSSLRMRPDRIVVGEVRGAEALDMLQAMNTGHDGSLSTGHANSTKDMLSRLETMVLQAAPLPLEAIRQQIGSALDIIIHLSRLRDFSRRTVEICEVLGCKNGEIELNPLFRFVETGEENGKVMGGLVRTENPMQKTEKLQMAGLPVRI
jgi:pilus assembly protein CpaF